jgi:microsomal dipeptidase-like Zn-dependent dipeptidase
MTALCSIVTLCSKFLIIALIWATVFCPDLGFAADKNLFTVDLHAHLFMSEGSGFPFFGHFNEPLHAHDWSSHFKTRVNAETLERSGVRIAVVALYSHPLFFRSLIGGQRESVRHQIAEVRHFVSIHPNWIIARNSTEARNALAAGKRVLIFSLEGASGVLETESDIHEFVDQAGIRIVTPLHFINDDIGGAALMPGLASLVNPFAATGSWIRSRRDSTGALVNGQGLTSHGKELIALLVKHGVWIDLSHASDASIQDLLPILRASHQPLLFTHTILREAFRGERGISTPLLQEVAKSGGILGLLPSDDMLKGTEVPGKLCPPVCQGQCSGGEAAFATQYQELKNSLPASRIFIGSDIHAPIAFLKPECPEMKKQNPHGYWNYAQLPELVDFLKEPELLWVNEFLIAWSEAEHGR